MPTYLVRTIKDQDLVGIFVARNLRELLRLVDECTEPDLCEFVRMTSGGVMWTSPAITIPMNLGSDEDHDDSVIEEDPVPWKDATLTEGWWAYFWGHVDAMNWRPVFPDGPVIEPIPGPDRPAGKVLPFRKPRKP